MFKTIIKLDPSHLDADYQHVHHTQVLKFFEDARLEFMKSAGLPQDKLFELDLWPVVSEIHIEYHREITLGEYTVSCDSITSERKRLRFEQSLLDLNSNLYAQATIRLMWISKKKARSVTAPPEVTKAILHKIEELNLKT